MKLPSADATTTTGDSTVRGGLEAANAEIARAAAVAQRAVAAALFGSAPAEPIGGRYRLGECLGTGAQGAVWRAFDDRLGRDVAIKTHHIDARVESIVAQQWLRHEAKMLGRVAHPNVVAVFDVGFASAASFGGDHRGVVLYAVLEFVRGRTLTQWLAERPRGVDEIGRLFLDLAAGLQAAHDAGLVHCDVKPGNVFVTDDGVAKLGDFGLAHAERVLQARADEITQDAGAPEPSPSSSSPSPSSSRDSEPDARTVGPVGGTPLYMPPEQFERRVVDARADQYALAATWFQALFGRPPHRGAGVLELEAAKREGAPPRPTTQLSRAQYAALARALDPDPARRHADVRAFARAVTRRGAGARVAVVGAVALAGVAWVLTTGRPEAVQGCRPADFAADREARFTTESIGPPTTYDVHLAEKLASAWNGHVDAREAARRDVCAAEVPSAGGLKCLATLGRLAATIIEPEGIRGRRAFERALSVVANLPDPQACVGTTDAGWAARLDGLEDVEGELQRASGVLGAAQELEDEGRPAEALAALDELDRESVAAAVYRDEIDLLRGGIHVALGEFAAAEASYQAVWDRTLAAGAPIDAVRAAGGLAHVVGFELQRPDEGLAWIRHGHSQLERFGGAAIFEAELLAISATIRGAAGELDLAIEELGGAIALVDDEPLFASMTMGMRENLALFQLLHGDLEAAERGLRRVAAWREAELGPTHPDVARSWTNLAQVAARRGDDATAEQLLDRAMAILEDASSPRWLEIAKIESSRAALALRQRAPQRALASMGRADAIRERLLPPDHPDLAAGVIFRIDVLLALDDVAGADALASVSRDRLATVLGSGTDAALSLEYTLARIDSLAGRTAQGLARLGPLIEQAEGRPQSARFLALWCVQAGALAGALGDLDGARTWADRASRHLRLDDAPTRRQLEGLRAAIDAASG
jgi:tetratricopeptide (TPR) repeat protein